MIMPPPPFQYDGGEFWWRRRFSGVLGKLRNSQTAATLLHEGNDSFSEEEGVGDSRKKDTQSFSWETKREGQAKCFLHFRVFKG